MVFLHMDNAFVFFNIINIWVGGVLRKRIWMLKTLMHERVKTTFKNAVSVSALVRVYQQIVPSRQHSVLLMKSSTMV